MAEQDELQTGKAGSPAPVPADATAEPKPVSGPGSLSAAAEAAAAKIEASLIASRAAKAAAKANAEAKNATDPTAAKSSAVPAKSSAVPAGSSAVPTKSSAVPAKAPVAKSATATKPAVAPKPAEKPKAEKPKVEKPEEIEDIIAMIPVEPLPETSKVAVTPGGSTGTPASGTDVDATRAMPRTSSAGQNTPQTASAVAEARSRVFGAYTPVPEPTPAARERRSRREAALESKPPLARTLQVLLAICYPFLLLIIVIRLIASPIFLWIAYRLPGFPADSFGFSTADRLNYGSFGVDFLNNVADNRYLGELRDASGNLLFLATEVQHMADVKRVMSLTYLAGVILGVIVLVALIYLGKRYAGGIRRGLFAGSVATIVLLAGLTTVAVLGWDTFFTSFHKIFFANGTWTFSYSDTLIRLYPPEFWVDAAIGIAGLVLITSLITMIATWPTAKRRELARLRQEKRVFGL